MRLAELVAASRDVTATPGRLAKIDRLAGLLAAAGPGERAEVTAWLAGDLPQGRIGLGPATVYAAVAAAPAPPADATLSVAEVDAAFTAVAGARGGAKARALGALLARATADERDLLARLVVGELRHGALEGVLAEAVAKAAGVPAAEVRRAAMFAGALPPVAVAALAGGEAGLSSFRLRLGVPVQPMLASPATDVAAALETAGGEAAFEWKLDGARVQVHKDGDEVRAFSRSLREVTASVPEVVGLVRASPARSLVLDGEALALRPDGSPEPFQVTMQRFGRRGPSGGDVPGAPLVPFFFDALLVDGEDLTGRPARERWQALGRAVPAANVVPRLVTGDAAAALAFFEDALRRGHEGVVAKAPGAAYEAGRRGAAWLKVKRAHTLDLVVLAVERGSGRRRGLLSNLWLGARDPASGGFAMLGKTFKGMTDALLRWQTERLGALAVREEGHVVHVRPELVVEVAFDGIQASPTYPSGLALRFARVKGYREDKRADEADTVEAVRALFDAQGGSGGTPG